MDTEPTPVTEESVATATPAAEPSVSPAAEPAATEAKPAETTATGNTSAAETPATPTPVPAKPRRKTDWAGVALDVTLVGLLIGAIGAGIWYLNKELGKVRVPSPMEMAVQKNVELCQQRDALQAKAFHADEQLHQRRRVASLVQQCADKQRLIEEKKAAIESAHQQVLALQHDIRQEDKTNRSVAKGLLPGMPIGDASTTTGRVHRNAVIHRLEGNRVSLRTPEGQVRFPLRELVKDGLPDIARYAFGIDDLVDMSDFEVTAGTPAPKPRKGKLITPAAPAPQQPKAEESTEEPDYEGDGGAPVVDTEAPTVPADGGSDFKPIPATDSWQPPTGDLPM